MALSQEGNRYFATFSAIQCFASTDYRLTIFLNLGNSNNPKKKTNNHYFAPRYVVCKWGVKQGSHNMPQKFFGRYLRVATLLVVSLAAAVPAQAQLATAAAQSIAPGVTGRTATVVGITQGGVKAGEIRKIDQTHWIEFDATGQGIFKYDEIKRDDASISILDSSRGVTLQIDVRARKVISVDAARRRRDTMYQIDSASAEPVKMAEPGSGSVGMRPVGSLTARERSASAMGGAPREETPPFCWTDVFTRPAGTIPGRPADCPSGYSLSGGSCKRSADTIAAPSRVADCPAGYTNNGSACERPAATKANTNTRAADCPKDFTNTGNECFRLSAPNPLPASSMTCKAGETKVESRCYRACETGFTTSGTNCVRAASTLGVESMSCKTGFQKNAKGRCVADCAAGYTNTGEACVRSADTLGAEAMVCKAGETRSGSRCLPAGGMCAKGEVLQAGLCYSACPAGTDGVGSACLPPVPKSWAQCGLGASKDATACAALTLDPVASVKQLAIIVGQSASATPQAARVAGMQKKFKELNDAYARAKDLPKLKKAREDWEQGAGKDGASLSLDKIGSATSEEEMLRYAAQLAVIVDLAGPIELGAYPKCSKPSGK